LAKWDLYYGFFNPVFGKRLRQVVEGFKPDIIHCQFGPDGLLFLDHFPNRSQIPVFVQFRGYDASSMYTKKSYINRLRQVFDQPWIHPIYVAHHQYERTLKLGLQPDKRRVLYSCTDTDFFTFKPKSNVPSKTTFRFLQVGRLVEGKGHEFTLLAFQRVLLYLCNVGKNATLTFVGSGKLENSLRQKCDELGLSGQVKFFQSVSQRAVMAFLQDTDFFLHPSLITNEGRIEGIPNAIMEALAIGVPVVATKHPGIEELMCPGGALFMVQEWNIAEYADTMIKLVEGKLRYELAISRKMIEEKFSAKQHIANLLGFYEEEVTLSTSQTRMCN
jgi:colanic acid/amylovoran biosynthesis glycosyltransferase